MKSCYNCIGSFKLPLDYEITSWKEFVNSQTFELWDKEKCEITALPNSTAFEFLLSLQGLQGLQNLYELCFLDIQNF